MSEITKIRPEKLRDDFLAKLALKTYRGINPFYIEVDQQGIFVYIKNLSPARLSNNNPDIWRIQLPVKEEFWGIKNSDALFFLFGYDSDNKVYTTWNPYWCKQRLNIGKSVSLYSRLSLQQRVHQGGMIEQMELNNEGLVVCLPEDKVYLYIKSYKDYFPEETLFVAKGSRIQKRLKSMVDPFGKLLFLDDQITEKLYPIYKDEAYPDFEKMISIAEGYYPREITDTMTPSDWISLFRNTPWRKGRK